MNNTKQSKLFRWDWKKTIFFFFFYIRCFVISDLFISSFHCIFSPRKPPTNSLTGCPRYLGLWSMENTCYVTNAIHIQQVKFRHTMLPYFGKRKQVTKVTFLVKEQNVSVISTEQMSMEYHDVLPNIS